MAGKKNVRSSKTDHVLNLLSGGSKGAAPQQEQPSATQPDQQQPPVRQEAEAHKPSQQAPQPQHSAQPEGKPQQRESGHRMGAPILHVARTNHEAVSGAIRDALSQALEEELAQQAREEQAREEKAREEQAREERAREEKAREEKARQEQAREEEARQERAREEQARNAAPAAPLLPEAEPSGQGEPPFVPTRVILPQGEVCLNVMEVLVDQRIQRYVHMFGLCTCPRCLADVRALALTRLPAKYVVFPPQAATPMLSFYQAKYESEVIAQVIYACKAVMDYPRHLS